MHPILIDFGFFSLSTYGLLVAAGYLAGILWLKETLPRAAGLSEDRFWLLIYALFFGAVMGGKLLYVAVEWRDFAQGRQGFLRDFRWGFVFYGGFLGAAAMGWLLRRRLKFDFLTAADYFAVALPLGHGIGRLGCLAAGCCYGRPTEAAWGVVFSPEVESSVPPALRGVALHPTQLYESAALLAIWGLLRYALLPRVRRLELKKGTVFLAYVLLYSAARFAIESFRGDPRGAGLGPFSVSQAISLAVGGAGAALLALRGPRQGRSR